ncbi:putative hydrolase [Dinoroseobacter shibae DFL 12 = DSM 16493]|jgi:acetyl esterase/lipase|uniref:Putative hydrolase n=1 Tax=Dinoroseobacter shibae (strain DSM 16493 / NCIMB 14021 / DFL 12) TaxID=398580 RepID=A8LMG1_DINSH|nr:alpha/beta hydrolase [Dinoroseobacter shibae]ABV93506.1 putative hydrolase [Dinoroseobacter shibae DFL 12 = DSM 16493]URF48417.1 alpha/beta hydrolase [Dinoroseobacter shibae]URF52727.1 alpha/beta hydrolase [Dinoroseobacter shibae]
MTQTAANRALRRIKRFLTRTPDPEPRYRPNRRALFYPGQAKDGPVFITYHGGGWVGGRAEDQVAWSQSFARMGRAAYSVEYSTYENSGGSLDASLDDAVAAAAFIVRRHKRAPLVFVGHSAGAPLAFWACLAHQAQLAGLILFSPVTDLSNEGFGNRQIPPGGRKDASPQHNLSRLHIGARAPFLLMFHGAEDDTVPPSQPQKFLQSWQDAGSEVARLITYPDQKHGFQNLNAPRITVQTDLEAAMADLGHYRRPAFLAPA